MTREHPFLFHSSQQLPSIGRRPLTSTCPLLPELQMYITTRCIALNVKVPGNRQKQLMQTCVFKNALVCDGLNIVRIASICGINHSMAAVDILILISSLSMFGLPGIVSYAIQVMNWTPPAISEPINYSFIPYLRF